MAGDDASWQGGYSRHIPQPPPGKAYTANPYQTGDPYQQQQFAGADTSGQYINQLEQSMGITGPSDSRSASYGALDAYLGDIQNQAATSAGMSGIKGGMAAGSMADLQTRAAAQGVAGIEGNYANSVDAWNANRMAGAQQYGRDLSGFNANQAQFGHSSAQDDRQFGAGLDQADRQFGAEYDRDNERYAYERGPLAAWEYDQFVLQGGEDQADRINMANDAVDERIAAAGQPSQVYQPGRSAVGTGVNKYSQPMINPYNGQPL